MRSGISKRTSDSGLCSKTTKEWKQYRDRWADYARAEQISSIDPILVVQVADAAKGRTGSSTSLDEAISTVNAALPSQLPSEAFAHSFDDGSALAVGNRTVRYVKPSKISSDRDVDVVFFKTALSTGWDCPQAEVMMSFRKAVDATYIAQLIGRMVRTPLARRIERDETLNTVALFLPHYDATGVEKVIKQLQDPKHEYVPPVDIERTTDSQILDRDGSRETAIEAVPEAHGRNR